MAEAPAPLRIYPGFAVPFGEVELTDVQGLNAELRELILERERAGDAYRNPDPSMFMQDGLYESRFDMFHWPDAPVVKLRERCTAVLFRLVGQLNGLDAEQLRELRVNMDAWFHVTRPGGMFSLHNHPMASWSGVYCVDNGYDGEAQTGELVFLHPAQNANMFLDLSVANLALPWGIRPKSYLLRPGQLVLFPSWMLHQVLPYQGPRERITVAFNAWFRKAPARESGKQP
jgi:uncharacterized protein (TIGR02466 family)